MRPSQAGAGGLPAEVIRTKRDGGALSAAQIEAFVRGLVDGSWADSQAAALAMAVLLRGMDEAETVALTRAMTHSGRVLHWRTDGQGDLPGPVLDKHSTGGVGDKVSLPLAPLLAACGAVVPMVSGRGLAHTGGTLDKLESLPGYTVEQPPQRLEALLRDPALGCAIVGAGAELAPADRRLYALRDATATVESVPLITASILSKKLAAGLQALVLDVKLGNGAFAPTREAARALAASLVRVARGAGLPARALITDMNEVLGRTAGNALEVRESLALLVDPDSADPRLVTLTLELAAQALHLAGLDASVAAARRRAARALAEGHAAERFARMVAALGGPPDVLVDARLPVAPVRRVVTALREGHVAALDVRALGLVVVALGGGRARPGDAVDPRVGLDGVVARGTLLRAGDPLAVVHAADEGSAAAAATAVRHAITLTDEPPAPLPLVRQVIEG